MSDTSHEATIALLYQAAAEPDTWRDALASLSQALGASCANLVGWDRNSGHVCFSAIGGDDSIVAGEAPFVQHYSKIDPRVPALLKTPVGTAFACHHHFDNRFVARNETYQDFLIPLGVRYTAGARLVGRQGIETMVGVLRPTSKGPFDAATLAQLDALLPHLTRATELYQRLQVAAEAEAALQGTLDAIAGAIIVTDGNGRLVLANRAGEELLRSGTGLRMKLGIVGATAPNDAKALARLIAEAEQTARGHGLASHGDVAIQRGAGRQPLMVTVAPLVARAAARFGQPQPAVALFVTDPEQRDEIPLLRLAKFFGLTPAEAKLAVGLAAGKSLDAIASELGIAKNTIRVHAQAVFRKTGTNRQSELVRLLVGLPAIRPPAP